MCICTSSPTRYIVSTLGAHHPSAAVKMWANTFVMISPTHTNAVILFLNTAYGASISDKPTDPVELWTIRTLANSALVNSNPKKFGPSQFGPRPLVNSDLDHWSIRTLFYWSIRTSKIKILWSIRTFSVG